MLNIQVARDNPAVDATFLPPKKATNKRIYPVQDTIGTVTDMGEAVQIPHQDMQQINSTQQKPAAPYQTPGVNPSTKAADTAAPAPTNSGGLLQSFANPSPIANSAAVKSAVTPVTYQPQEYKPVGANAAATAPTMNVPTVAAPTANYAPVTQNLQANAPTMNVPTVTAPTANYTPVTQNLQANAPTMNVPGSSFKPGSFQKDGYTGVQGNTDFSYTPSGGSLVENRIGGLLDPNNALMRKAAAIGNSYAASRGLQSSSIGGEIALSTMVDKALPIAQQDAQTLNQAQQLGWQQSWQSGESNLGRTHDASMADKQGQYQTNLQNTQLSAQSAENAANRTMQAELAQLQYKQSLNMLDAQGAQRMQELNAQLSFQANESNAGRQMQAELQQLQYRQSLGQLDAQGAQRMQELNAQLSFQANESNAGRQMQAELQQLQYKQSLGQLDAQGAQRMQELNAQAQASNFQQERGAQLQTERDQLIQQMQLQIADKSFLQQLELTRAQYEQADKTLMAQMNYQTQMEFKNATASAHNNYLQQVAAVYSNPNMTAQQQAAGVEQLRQAFESQRAMLQAVYGFSGNTPPNTTATGTGAGAGVGTGSGAGSGAGTGTSLPNPPQTTKNPFNGGYAEPRPVIGKGHAP